MKSEVRHKRVGASVPASPGPRHEGLLLLADALEGLVVGLLVHELSSICVPLAPLVKLGVIDL